MNAYAMYSQSRTLQHLRLLRAGVGGDFYPLTLGDWTSAGTGGNGSGSDSQLNVTPSAVNLITNADQGALASWEVDTNFQTDASASSSSAFYLATTSGTSVASNVQMSVPSQAAPVKPILQREDSSYIGTVAISPQPPYVQNEMIAFTASGTTLWSGPDDKPQIATAGGGVIGASGTTYDQNGNVTGQLASLPTYSWNGAYRDGDVASVVGQLSNLLPSFAAVAGGNYTGNGTSTVTHSFGIFWCGTGYLEQGNPPAFPSCIDPIAFALTLSKTEAGTYFAAQPTDENINQLQNFSKTYPSWVATIEGAALRAYKKAFANYPISVVFATTHPEYSTLQLGYVQVLGNL